MESADHIPMVEKALEGVICQLEGVDGARTHPNQEMKEDGFGNEII